MPRPKSGKRTSAASAAAQAHVTNATPAPAPVAAPQFAAPGTNRTGTDSSNGNGTLLSAVAGLKKVEEEVRTAPDQFEVEQISIDDIAPNPFNPQHRNIETDDEIVASIREVGVLEPVILVDRSQIDPSIEIEGTGSKVLLAGARRRAGSKKAGRTTVPAITRNEFASRRSMLEIVLIENLHRLNLSPIEEAERYQLLRQDGASLEDIRQAVGYSVGHISKRLKLLGLTDLAKTALNEGTISTTGALKLIDKLSSNPDRLDAAVQAATNADGQQSTALSAAIERHTAEIEAEQRAEKLRLDLERAGIAEINPSEQWGDDAWQHRIDASTLAEAQNVEKLAGAAIDNGRLYFYAEDPSAPEAEPAAEETATKPDSEPAAHDGGEFSAGKSTDQKAETTEADTKPEPSAEDRRKLQDHSDAAAQRADACRRLMDKFAEFRDSKRRELTDILADGVLAGHVTPSTLKNSLTEELYGRRITESDLADIIRTQRGEAHRLALAGTLAALLEQAGKHKYATTKWPAHIQHFVQRLVDLGYHTLSEHEHTLMD
ncbi:ParB/RepB/Spo0J family partition protein [Saccharopolyspora griseoalba]|uniref:ParB/RepB/Spo0J family partition protein n=1 Tax=Saccharopolyspora griseoalba TaxID=1431848 RepID=A0ABW2LTC3_9PSEU